MLKKLSAEVWAMLEAKRVAILDEMRGEIAAEDSANHFAAVNLLSVAGGANAAAAALPARQSADSANNLLSDDHPNKVWGNICGRKLVGPEGRVTAEKLETCGKLEIGGRR